MGSSSQEDSTLGFLAALGFRGTGVEEGTERCHAFVPKLLCIHATSLVCGRASALLPMTTHVRAFT